MGDGNLFVFSSHAVSEMFCLFVFKKGFLMVSHLTSCLSVKAVCHSLFDLCIWITQFM